MERIRIYLLGNVNKAEFAKMLGYSHQQSYTNFTSGRSNLTLKMIEALRSHLPLLNINFLLWGQGNMLLSSPSITDQKIMNGDHTQATITGNITNNNKDASLFDKKHVEFLEEKIKDKEINIKTLQELLESKKITINLYQERVAALEKEVQQLREQKN